MLLTTKNIYIKVKQQLTYKKTKAKVKFIIKEYKKV